MVISAGETYRKVVRMPETGTPSRPAVDATAADIAGYSALMGADEALTVEI